MNVGERVRFLCLDGPMTVVRSAFASAAERGRALDPRNAAELIRNLCQASASGDHRHTVCAIHQLLSLGRSIDHSRLPTAAIAPQLFDGAASGELLVLDGWMMGDDWTPSRSTSRASRGTDGARPVGPETHVARRVMGARSELAHAGKSYVVVPTEAWDDFRDRGDFEVVHHVEATATLQRLAEHAASPDVRTAMAEAVGLLADTRSRFTRGGLYLLRRREVASWSSRHDEPAVSPSHFRRLAAGPAAPAPHLDKVSPVLTVPAPKVVLVKKDFQHHPHRLAIRLSTDRAFDGTAVLSGTNVAGLHVYAAAAEAGEGKTLPLTAIPGDKLSAGITVFLEARQPSHAVNEAKLTLHLDGGTSPRGADVHEELTFVELTLDICASRTGPAADPAPLSAADKLAVGRYVQRVDPGHHHARAKLIVRKPVPAAFAGKLELRALDGRVQAFAARHEVPAGGQPAVVTNAAPEVVDCAAIPAAGHVVWAEGAGTSGGLRDTGFGLDLQGVALPEHADRVAMTVVEFTQIQATVKATPPNTVRPGFAPPASHVFQSHSIDPDFVANAPLVLMRNAQPDIDLEVTVAPANVPVRWAAVRNPADHATLGGAGALPTVTADAAHPPKARLSADNRGSFRIRPFIDCNGNNHYNDGEPSIPLNLVLADVRVVVDNSAAFVGNLAAQALPGGVEVRNGTWPPTWAASIAPGGAGMTMELVADVTGGGADGRLGLDCVFGGLVNMLTGPNIRLIYRDSTGPVPVDLHVDNIYATNLVAATGHYAGARMFLPADPPPALFAVPFLDTGRNPGGIGGDTATMSRSGGWDPPPVNRPVGQRWTLRCIDSPGRGFLAQHPTRPAAKIFRIHYEQRFRANSCFWTNVSQIRGATGDPADRVYSVVRTMAWTVRGDWNVNWPAGGAPVLVNTTPHTIAINGPATVAPIGRAQDHGVEVRPPSGIVMGIGWQTT